MSYLKPIKTVGVFLFVTALSSSTYAGGIGGAMKNIELRKVFNEVANPPKTNTDSFKTLNSGYERADWNPPRTGGPDIVNNSAPKPPTPNLNLD